MSPRPLVCMLALCAALIPAAATSAEEEPSFLDVVNRALAEGTITRDEAFLNVFYYGFEPERVRADLRVEDGEPIKCLTPMITEFLETKDSFDPATIEIIEGYLDRPAGGNKTGGGETPRGGWVRPGG